MEKEDLLKRKVGLLSRIFEGEFTHDIDIFSRLVKRFDEILLNVYQPDLIQEIIDLALKGYDTSKVFVGKKQANLDNGGNFIVIGKSGDEKITLGDISKCNQRWQIQFPQPTISRCFVSLMQVGLGIPSYATEIGDVYHADLMERAEDSGKFLLVETRRAEDVRRPLRVYRTNSVTYACNHENLGFKVE